MNDQKEFDRQWIRAFAGRTTAVRYGDNMLISDLFKLEEILERNGVNTDDLTGEEKLSDLIGQTGLFSYLYALE